MKKFISADQLTLDSFKLAVQIYESGFRPNFIVGLWRGGSAVGIIVQDCLDFLGVPSDHISLRTSYRGAESYQELINNEERIRVHGIQYLLDSLNSEDRLLIVDDVYGSGFNVKAVIDRLSKKMRRNMPADVRVAVPWYKPGRNRTDRIPDFYLHETDEWLVMPYELNGLSDDEIEQHKPLVRQLAANALIQK
ncbi:MAG: hypoxanthine phosphoribosyltransferase [Oceanicoccus sp.]|jgi:hypoxanthine phosphoribosyltransferase